MSYTLAPITLTVNVTTLVSIPGDMGSVSWVKLTNASPYLVQLTNLGASGQDYLQPGECNTWQVPGLTTAIQATPLQFATAPSLVPVQSLVVTWYGQGEEPPGTYPVNFNLLSYTGNTLVSASEVINDGYAAGTNVIEATPQGATASYLLARNDGTLDVQAISNGTLTDILHVTPGTSGTPAQLVLQLLKTLGALSLDSGRITTDGAGTLTLSAGPSGFTGQGLIVQAVNGSALSAMGGTNNPDGGLLALAVSLANSASTQTLVLLGSLLGITAPTALMIDNNQTVYVLAPPKLYQGHQASGPCGAEFTATAANQVFGVAVPYGLTTTNTPTSITLTVSTSGNLAAGFPQVLTISNQGFFLILESAAAGTCFWRGSFTTVGN